MLLAPIIWVLTVIICYVFAAKIWWFPPPISAHGMEYDAQFMRTLVITGIIFFFAQLALGYVIIRFRDNGGRASYSHGNNKMEAIWTSATAVLFIGIVLMGTKIWASVHFVDAPADAIPIEVLGKQFAWSFRYPGPDGKFGRTDLKLINDANGNPFGLDDKDPARQGRYRQRLSQSARRQADQAHSAFPRCDPQFLRARTSPETGHCARHGNSLSTSRPM